MGETTETLKKVLSSRGKDLHGKEKSLFYLVTALLGISGSLTAIFVRKKMPFEVFQVIVICVVALIVWQFARFKVQSERSNH